MPYRDSERVPADQEEDPSQRSFQGPTAESPAPAGLPTRHLGTLTFLLVITFGFYAIRWNDRLIKALRAHDHTIHRGWAWGLLAPILGIFTISKVSDAIAAVAATRGLPYARSGRGLATVYFVASIVAHGIDRLITSTAVLGSATLAWDMAFLVVVMPAITGAHCLLIQRDINGWAAEHNFPGTSARASALKLIALYVPLTLCCALIMAGSSLATEHHYPPIKDEQVTSATGFVSVGRPKGDWRQGETEEGDYQGADLYITESEGDALVAVWTVHGEGESLSAHVRQRRDMLRSEWDTARASETRRVWPGGGNPTIPFSRAVYEDPEPIGIFDERIEVITAKLPTAVVEVLVVTSGHDRAKVANEILETLELHPHAKEGGE